MVIRRRPEKDTENPPGQIVYRPSHFEKPLVKNIEEYQERCPETGIACTEGCDKICRKEE